MKKIQQIVTNKTKQEKKKKIVIITIIIKAPIHEINNHDKQLFVPLQIRDVVRGMSLKRIGFIFNYTENNNITTVIFLFVHETREPT